MLATPYFDLVYTLPSNRFVSDRLANLCMHCKVYTLLAKCYQKNALKFTPRRSNFLKISQTTVLTTVHPSYI